MDHKYWWVTPVVIASIAILGYVIAVVVSLMKFSSWKTGVDKHMETVDGFMKEIDGKIDKIQDYLLGSRKVLESESPITLTEMGKTISSEISAKEWAESTAPILLERAKKFSKEFEIYELCKDYVKHEFVPNEEILSQMREVAYEHGIDVVGVYSVFSVELRDELLKLIKLD